MENGRLEVDLTKEKIETDHVVVAYGIVPDNTLANASGNNNNNKRFYKRETNYAANVFHIPLPFFAIQMINPFLYSRNSANHDKWEES